MRRVSYFAMALLLSAASSPPPTVDSLVEAHIKALGGIDAIHAIHCFTKDGWYREGTLRIHAFTAQMRPFYRVIGDPRTHPLDHEHEGYDGSAWEYYPDPGIVVRTIGEAARATRHSASFDDPLVDYRDHGTSITDGGERDYHGMPVFILHVKLADGFDEDYFLDRSTYMLDGRAQAVPMHAFGTRYKTEDVYGDYRAETGVMFSHSDEEIDSATGKVLDSGGVDSMQINPDLPISMFSPPEWKRTPLQQMIQRIYDERDEARAVMATYRDFSTLVDERAAATGDAVDFAGYQCLKMGHVDTALALLAQNVADHPGSSRAHFGLGRALATSGQNAKARSEFTRALQLDPSNERAKAALSTLPR